MSCGGERLGAVHVPNQMSPHMLTLGFERSRRPRYARDKDTCVPKARRVVKFRVKLRTVSVNNKRHTKNNFRSLLSCRDV